MPISAPTAEALHHAGITYSEDVPIAKRTYWRAGGVVDGLVRVDTLDKLQQLLSITKDQNVPYLVLGNGSNLLMSDHGLRGLVIQLSGDFMASEVTQESADLLQVGAGLKLNVLLRRSAKNQWAGLECFAGIPGTIGGAIRMNAGATLGETKDCLHDVDVVLPNGQLRTLTMDELHMSYRTTHLPMGSIIAFARLNLSNEDPAESLKRIQHHMERRKATQPLHLPSCGSTFRNPPNDHAGRLIEAAGLKGFQLGQAQISTKHANFIVNLGEATSDDIRAVLEHAKKEVLQQFGVALHQEVHFVGDWTHWDTNKT